MTALVIIILCNSSFIFVYQTIGFSYSFRQLDLAIQISFCASKMTAFLQLKLLVFEFLFELFRLGSHSYSDNWVVGPL